MTFRTNLRHAWRSSLVAELSLFFFALGIRLLYLRGAPVWPVSFSDAGGYLLEASVLLQGDWRNFFTSAICTTQGPVYPLLASIIFLLSGRRADAIEAIPRNPNLLDPNLVMPIQIVQAILGALTSVAIAVAGRRTGSRLGSGAGLIGGSFFAVLPTDLLYTSYTMTEVAGTAIAAIAVSLAVGPPNVWRQVGVGLMLGIATMTRITLAYAAVLVPASTILAGDRGSLTRRIKAAGCGVLVVVAILFAWRSLIIIAGGEPFVGSGGVSSRLDAMVDSADLSHFGWGDDRIPYYRVPYARPDSRRLAAKQWTLERDGDQSLDQEGIQLGTQPARIPGEQMSRWRVPSEVTEIIQGNYVKVNVTAPTLSSGVLPEVRYVAPYQFSSSWHQVRPGNPLDIFVPLTIAGNQHFIELRDTDPPTEVTKIELVLPRFPANLSEFLITIARVLANSFTNFWYADTYGNIVGSEQFPNGLIQGLQHVLLVLAAIGAARACVEFGSWAPIMAFWAAGVIVGFDWIENRHNIPFMPAVCLLAGLGAIWLGMLLLIRRSCLYSLPLLTGTTFMLVGAICAAMDALSVPFIAWTPLSDLSLPLALTGGAILLWNACSALKVMRRLVVLSPIFIFLFAYVCYVSTDPTPRWRHHYASIPQDGTRLAQRFTLWTGKIVKAAVLLDFEMMDRTANLTVRLNGTVIAETMETAHSRYPNDVNSPDPASVRDTWRLYAAGQRPLDKWPQWWQIEFDPKLLTGPNAQIEISLARSAPALRIGIYNGEESGAFIGPSVSRTSIYRWLTTGDWRFWESFPTTGTIEGAILLQDQNISRPYGATLGIRLITEDRSGNIALY